MHMNYINVQSDGIFMTYEHLKCKTIQAKAHGELTLVNGVHYNVNTVLVLCMLARRVIMWMGYLKDILNNFKACTL